MSSQFDSAVSEQRTDHVVTVAWCLTTIFNATVLFSMCNPEDIAKALWPEFMALSVVATTGCAAQWIKSWRK